MFDYWEGSRNNAGDKYVVNGNHTFTAVWKAADKGGSDSEDSGKSSSANKGVKTGDGQNPAGWIALMAAAALALAAFVIGRKNLRHR